MRSTRLSLLATVLALSLAACSDPVPEEPRVRHLTVLFTTDEHSNLFAVAPELDDFDLVNHTLKTGTGDGSLKGGVARRFAMLESERASAAARGATSITLSAGDFTEGSLVNGALLTRAPDFVLLRRMGYDAAALGNHEFDLGPAGLAKQIQTAQERLGATGDVLPPLLLSNLILDGAAGTDDDGLEAYSAAGVIVPSTVVTKDDLEIGIVSWMGVSAGTDAAGAAPARFWSAAADTSQKKFAEIAAAVQAKVDELRNTQGVDVVIALGHGGIGPLVTGPGDDEVITSLTSGIDLVVSGHSHKAPHEVHVATSTDDRSIPVVQAGPYGSELGRVELVVKEGERATLSSDMTSFIAVDSHTAPTSDSLIVSELLGTIDEVEGGFAKATLLVAGICAPADTACYSAANRGDLYYKPICRTSFYTRGLGGGESNVMNIDTDAMLDVANEIAGAGSTAIALQNYGAIRTDLVEGLTGDLTLADLFRAVPNGVDPGTGTAGFPLVRVGIANVELRAALEGALLKSMEDGDYFLSGSGIRVEYDKTRQMFDPDSAQTDPFQPGWITRIVITSSDPDVVVYDAALDGIVIDPPYGPGATHFLVYPTAVQPVVTTYYVASFASAFGVHLYSLAEGTLLNPPDPAPSALYSAVMRWPDGRPGTDAPPAGLGSAVKDSQSFLKYVAEECAANSSSPGYLPSRYDDSAAEGEVPRRMVDCTGGVCP